MCRRSRSELAGSDGQPMAARFSGEAIECIPKGGRSMVKVMVRSQIQVSAEYQSIVALAW